MEFQPTHPRATPVSEELEQTAPRADPWVGKVIDGRYRLEGRLAAGGMGEVYRATHVELERALALKMMRPELSTDPSFVDRFRREALTSSRLGHPHIVDIIDSGRTETGQFYFVMEFLDGAPLSELIASGPVALPLALDLTAQIAEALEVAHRAGVVHRDLKPDNVIVIERSGKAFVKLVDFGIAKLVTPAPDQKQTTHGVIMGTPQYMAPEQAAGVVLDARADIYALGLILFELLTGKPPITGETAALVMAAHINRPAPELPSTFPQPLRALVGQMLAKRPGARPASMAVVVEALAQVPRAMRSARAFSSRVVGALAVLVAMAVGLIWLATHRSEPGVPLEVQRPAPAQPPAPATISPAPPVPGRAEQPSPPSPATISAPPPGAEQPLPTTKPPSAAPRAEAPFVKRQVREPVKKPQPAPPSPSAPPSPPDPVLQKYPAD